MNSGNSDVVRYLKGTPGSTSEKRNLALEEPLVVSLLGGSSFTIMRTPGHDRELTAGFLLAEGIIFGKEDVASMDGASGHTNEIRVTLKVRPVEGEKRNLAVLSSCGICGRPNPDALADEIKPLTAGIHVPPEVLYEVPGIVRKGQELFRQTGATHAAALFNVQGEVAQVFEDLGRHNALDKAIGNAILTGADMTKYGAFLSGRVSFEMVVKAGRAGISIIAAVSAPTDAAVRLAKRLNITLCGFVRGEEITIYTKPERVG